MKFASNKSKATSLSRSECQVWVWNQQLREWIFSDASTRERLSRIRRLWMFYRALCSGKWSVARSEHALDKAISRFEKETVSGAELSREEGLRWFWRQPLEGWLVDNGRHFGWSDSLKRLWCLYISIRKDRWRVPNSMLHINRKEIGTFFASCHPRKTSKDDTTYVFIFLGEFGYELMNWQGVVRKFSTSISKSSSIVIGTRHGMEAFYESADQVINLCDCSDYKESFAGGYFAKPKGMPRRQFPPSDEELFFQNKLKKTIIQYIDARINNRRSKVEFIFSCDLNIIDNCHFGVDRRYYPRSTLNGAIYRQLSGANNIFAKIKHDEGFRASLEERLGFALSEPYLLVQTRNRLVGPQSGRGFDPMPLLQELAKKIKTVVLGFDSQRFMDSGSKLNTSDRMYQLDVRSFKEQSCLIHYAQRCLFITEGDLGSHTYLPPMMGKDVYVLASSGVFERDSAPINEWNKSIFSFGGQMLRVDAERVLHDHVQICEFAALILSGSRCKLIAVDSFEPVIRHKKELSKRVAIVMSHPGFMRLVMSIAHRLLDYEVELYIIYGPVIAKNESSSPMRVIDQFSSERPECNIANAIIRDDKWTDFIGDLRALKTVQVYNRNGHPAPEWGMKFADKNIKSNRINRILKTKIGKAVLCSKISSVICKSLEEIVPPCGSICKWLKNQHIDLVLAIPYIYPSQIETEYIKAARKLKIQTIAMVASWDNLTSKGAFQIIPDKVFTWNEALNRECIELHGIRESKLLKCGTPLFDYLFDMKPTVSRECFLGKIEVSASEKYILYLCSSSPIAGDETDFILELADEMANDAKTSKLKLVVRPHPINIGIWSGQSRPNMIIYPWGGDRPDVQSSQENYFHSMYYASAIIGINTSATLEAAIVNRPCLSIVTPRFKIGQERAHFKYLSGGGFMEMASSMDELIEIINSCASGNDRLRENRIKFVKDFLRPNGVEKPSAEESVNRILNMMADIP
jgi:hypothetical protein